MNWLEKGYGCRRYNEDKINKSSGVLFWVGNIYIVNTFFGLGYVQGYSK